MCRVCERYLSRAMYFFAFPLRESKKNTVRQDREVRRRSLQPLWQAVFGEAVAPAAERSAPAATRSTTIECLRGNVADRPDRNPGRASSVPFHQHRPREADAAVAVEAEDGRRSASS